MEILLSQAIVQFDQYQPKDAAATFEASQKAAEGCRKASASRRSAAGGSEDSVCTPRDHAPAADVSWARLRSPSPEAGNQEESGPLKCVFWEAPRGLPALPRAWRTPDPSPVRENGQELPSTKPPTIQLIPQRAAARGRHASRDERQPEAWARVRTPSPEASYPLWGTDSQAVPNPAFFPLMLSQQVPPPPPPPVELPSAGTMGHPDTCGEPCKYFWKANGCKDGKDCTRCHVCKWTRAKGPKKPH